MRVLLLHAESFSYTPTKRAVSHADEEAAGFEAKNALIALTSVEEGDDEEIIEASCNDIVEQAARVKADIVVIYPYAHLSSNLAPLNVSRDIINRLSERLRREGIKVHKAPFGWYKAFEIKVHGHPLAELSRAYTKKERLPPLIEVSRDFADRLFGDYLKRFGLSLEGERTRTGALWQSAVSDLALDLALCQGLEGVVETRSILDEQIEGCVEYVFDGMAQPIRATLRERGVVTSTDRLRGVLSEAALREERRLLWAEGKWFKALVALKADEDRLVAFLNTILICLIALNVERMTASQIIPALPTRYAVVQAYVAVNQPVSESYVKSVEGTVRGALKRVMVDNSEARLAEKLRRAGMLWAPYTVIVGRREEETASVSVRTRADGTTRTVPLSELRGFLKTGPEPSRST